MVPAALINRGEAVSLKATIRSSHIRIYPGFRETPSLSSIINLAHSDATGDCMSEESEPLIIGKNEAPEKGNNFVTSPQDSHHLLVATELAAAAYFDKDKAHAFCRSLFEVPRLDWDEQATVCSQALLAADGPNIYLAFRGTESASDIMIDLVFGLTRHGAGHVHEGFLSATNACFEAVYVKLQRLGYGGAGITLHVSGHSLGGAVAMLFVHMLSLRGAPVENVNLYTFGQPRCGNRAFIAEFDSFGIPYWRFSNLGDLVPLAPPPLLKHTWSHSGREIVLSDKGVENGIITQEPIVRLLEFVLTALSYYFKDKASAVDKIKKDIDSTKHGMENYLARIRKLVDA